MVCGAAGTRLFLLMIHALRLGKAPLSDPHAQGLIHIKHKVGADEALRAEKLGCVKGIHFLWE